MALKWGFCNIWYFHHENYYRPLIKDMLQVARKLLEEFKIEKAN